MTNGEKGFVRSKFPLAQNKMWIIWQKGYTKFVLGMNFFGKGLMQWGGDTCKRDFWGVLGFDFDEEKRSIA